MIGHVHYSNATASDFIQNISVNRYQNFINYQESSANITTGIPNWERIIFEVACNYLDYLGQLVWFVLFAWPFVLMWITCAAMTPAAITGIFDGLYVFAYEGSQII
jgi:hypothetical protein